MAKGKGNSSRASSRVQAEVQRALKKRAEVKSILVSQAPTVISSTGSVSNITSTIAQGDDINQRNGDMIISHGATLNFRFRAISTDQTARFIVVRDNFNQGVAPVITDVLATPLYRSEFNPTNVIQQKRFTILLDRFLDSNLNGETLKTKTCTIPPHGRIYYNGGAAVGTSNGRGAIFLFVIGDAATGMYEFTYQVRYIDT